MCKAPIVESIGDSLGKETSSIQVQFFRFPDLVDDKGNTYPEDVLIINRALVQEDEPVTIQTPNPNLVPENPRSPKRMRFLTKVKILAGLCFALAGCGAVDPTPNPTVAATQVPTKSPVSETKPQNMDEALLDFSDEPHQQLHSSPSNSINDANAVIKKSSVIN